MSAIHGMQLMDVSGYGTSVPLYAALWVKTASAPAWQARHGLTAADYQATFNQLTQQGYHPVLVNGYATAAGPRFACIFQQGAADPWVARHGLTSAEYQAAFNQYTSAGLHARLGERLLRRHPGPLRRHLAQAAERSRLAGPPWPDLRRSTRPPSTSSWPRATSR